MTAFVAYPESSVRVKNDSTTLASYHSYPDELKEIARAP